MKEELEKYINANLSEFEQELPKGHKERFNKKLLQNSGKKDRLNMKNIIRIFSSIAAIIVIAFTIINTLNSDYLLEKKYERKIESIKKELIQLSLIGDENLHQLTLSTVDEISMDANSIINQLPDKLSRKQKEDILKDYYGKKIDGLNKFKVFLEGINQTINL